MNVPSFFKWHSFINSDVFIGYFTQRLHANADENNEIHASDSESEITKPPCMDSVPKIIACTTMWHENRVEMLQTLRSVMK